METLDFFQQLRQHCKKQAENFKTVDGSPCCPYENPFKVECVFRKFCFTPPINLSDEFVRQAQENLEKIRVEED